MTQEEKQLLLKDLCARLPYSIWGLHRGEDLPLYVIDNSGAYMVLGYNAWFDLDTIPFKPYLRLMSSMTEEEYEDLCCSCTWLWFENDLRTVMHGDYKCYDWLNKHHFDYRGLIEKGLALEAPEGMYNLKK